MLDSLTYERAELNRTESCGHHSRRSFWRKELHGKSTWFSDRERSYYDHLRAKVQNRRAYQSAGRVERVTRARWFVPSVINDLRSAIQDSRVLLTLEDNWDDEGSPGYSDSTWHRAESFLIQNAIHLWRRHKMCFDAPKIQPGPSGSLDLHWRTRHRELLINVPANPEEPISYYGDNKDDGTLDAVRGKRLDSSSDAEWIFLWLTS
jgi:hypothetical protein